MSMVSLARKLLLQLDGASEPNWQLNDDCTMRIKRRIQHDSTFEKADKHHEKIKTIRYLYGELERIGSASHNYVQVTEQTRQFTHIYTTIQQIEFKKSFLTNASRKEARVSVP